MLWEEAYERIYEAPNFKERPYLGSVTVTTQPPSKLQLLGWLLTISVTRKKVNSTSLPWPAVKFTEEDIGHEFQIDTARNCSGQDESDTCDDLPRSRGFHPVHGLRSGRQANDQHIYR
jgi:hypothetical protein